MAASLLLIGLACAAPREGPPDIVLVVLDTLRADRVSSYGYSRPTTPHLDALAAEGLRFSNARSTSSWTVPAHASLFTGLLPRRHGATQEHTRLDAIHTTLAEALAAAGYRTFAASANPLVAAQTGLDRGFEGFAATWRSQAGTRVHPNREVVRDFLAQLDAHDPLFLYVNYMEVHGPYQPPEPFRSKFSRSGSAPPIDRHETAAYYLDPATISAERFAELSDLYDAEVAYVDALLGELLDELEDAGRLEGSLVIVTSDHGENLGEHEHFRHVFNLYADSVRIPLVMRLPNGADAGRVVDAPVSLIDVHETVLAAAGLATRADAAGRDLRGPISNQPVFAEYYYPRQVLTLFTSAERERHAEVLAPYRRRLRSVERDGLRLIWSSTGDHELYDLSSDPGEQRNLRGDPRYAAAERALLALLSDFDRDAETPETARRSSLAAPAARDGAAPFGDLDRETEEQLRALGYLRAPPAADP